MTKIPDLRETIDPPKEVIQAALSGELVMFVGSGISMLLGLPSWEGLAEAVLEDLRQSGLLDFSEVKQLKTLGPKKQLSIAKLIAQENDHSFNLVEHFPDKPEGNSIYKALNDIGCVCVTTNYDELLTPRFRQTDDGSTTPTSGPRIYEKKDFSSNLLDSPGTVIHLHGAICNPGTMIVTTEDYLKHYEDENVREFLNDLFTRKTVVFMGYGLDEVEILEHILRRGSASLTGHRRRFLLWGCFKSEQLLYEKLYLYYEKSFGVQLLGFLRDYKNFACQEDIVKSWSRILKIRKPPLTADADLIDEIFPDE